MEWAMTQMMNRWLDRPATARRAHVPVWPALLLAAAALLATTTGRAAEVTAQERAALEKQLRDAQSRLDDAARDVADLTGKLHGDATTGSMDKAMRPHDAAARPRGAMLGINIGGEQTRADGVEVMSVSPSGPAEKAGLRKGDVVTSIDGKPLRKAGERSASRQLVEHLRGVDAGQAVKLDYLRDGKPMSASVTTVAAEPPMMRVMREHMPMLEGVELPFDLEAFVGGRGRGFRSLELVPITPKLGQYFGTDKGLLVVRAPAAAAGSTLEEGDVILSIGGRTPESPRHAFRILGSYQPSEQVKVELLRQRKRLTVEMQLPEDEGAESGHVPLPPRAPVPPVAPRTGSVSS
jgi:S1-C subfamily serine protease